MIETASRVIMKAAVVGLLLFAAIGYVAIDEAPKTYSDMKMGSSSVAPNDG